MSCLQQVARHLLRRLTSRNARIFLGAMGMAQLSARLHYAGLQLHLFSKTPRHPFITPKPWLQETTRVSILELKTSARSRHPILLQSLRCCLPAVCRLPDDDQFLGEDWHICESCNLVPPIHMICRLVDQLLHSGCDEGFPTYIHGAWFLYMCITNLMSFALLRTVSGQWPG